jgi:pSer/pThr/pTyr-binding forkhead associated (FHA) protein
MTSRQLHITLPSGRSHIVELADVNVIGRDSENEIVLDDAMVSRYHAMLFAEPQGIVLVDLESTNGTLLNGTLVLPDVPMPIKDGDLIAVGRVIACYREGTDRHPGQSGKIDALSANQAIAKAPASPNKPVIALSATHVPFTPSRCCLHYAIRYPQTQRSC